MFCFIAQKWGWKNRIESNRMKSHTRYQGISNHFTQWYEHITNKKKFFNQHKKCSIALLKSNRTSVIRKRNTSRMSLYEEEEDHKTKWAKHTNTHTQTSQHSMYIVQHARYRRHIMPLCIMHGVVWCSNCRCLRTHSCFVCGAKNGRSLAVK